MYCFQNFFSAGMYAPACNILLAEAAFCQGPVGELAEIFFKQVGDLTAKRHQKAR
jgi:hypothetical protein